jgi:hypothetical protein
VTPPPVDLLEVIHVHEKYGPPGGGRVLATDGGPDLNIEQLSVGESAQRVVRRPVGQILLQFPFGGHVPQRRHDAFHRGVLRQIAPVDQHREDPAVGALDDALSRLLAVRPTAVGSVAVYEIVELAARHAGPEECVGRRGRVVDATVAADESRVDVGQDERAEVPPRSSTCDCRTASIRSTAKRAWSPRVSRTGPSSARSSAGMAYTRLGTVASWPGAWSAAWWLIGTTSVPKRAGRIRRMFVG